MIRTTLQPILISQGYRKPDNCASQKIRLSLAQVEISSTKIDFAPVELYNRHKLPSRKMIDLETYSTCQFSSIFSHQAINFSYRSFLIYTIESQNHRIYNFFVVYSCYILINKSIIFTMLLKKG